MTHDELIKHAVRFLKRCGCPCIYTEVVTANRSGEIPDAIGFFHGVSILIECKTSLSDLYADRKKLFRRYPKYGMGNWRIILCEEDVIEPKHLTGVHAGWGLIYVGKRYKRICGCPRGNIWSSKVPFSPDLLSERALLVSVLRRREASVE